MTSSLLAFLAAAVLEIAGCFVFWAWLRRGAHASVVLLGILSLAGFATVLTRIDTASAGRAYAAYGGIHVAASLGWLWIIVQQRPTTADAMGAAVAVIGAVIILAFGSRQP